MRKTKIQRIIGELELMAAAAEPGIVMTEETSIICCSVLLEAAAEMRDNLNG